MPARRKIYRGNKSRKHPKVFVYLILILLALFIFFYFVISRKYWNGEDRLTLSVQKLDGDVNVVTFDPKTSEIINIVIPGATEVEVANQLGVWKLKSVWRLGEQEDLVGTLLARTITKHFKFPVYLWAHDEASGFYEGNIFALLKATLYPYSTNLTLSDRVSISLFSLGVKNTKRFEIKLEETGYLRKSTLADGEEGWQIVGKAPQDITSLFADPSFSEKAYRVVITDATGKANLAKEVGEVIEVLGGKISSVNRKDVDPGGCEIRGKDKAIALKVVRLFPCKLGNLAPQGNFDLEMIIGEGFAKSY